MRAEVRTATTSDPRRPARNRAPVDATFAMEPLSEIAGAGVSPRVWRVLARAAERLRGGAAGSAGAVLADEPACDVDVLCGAVASVVSNGVGDAELLRAVRPARRLLESLRECFLDELLATEEPLDAREVTRALRALETVREAVDRDGTQRLQERLGGPQALDMVVEVAHDMRSPLASILFLVETLRSGQSGTVNGVQERQLGLVYSAAFGLSAIASDLIDLARGGDPLMDPQAVPFSVAEMMRSVGDVVRPIAEEKRLSVTLTPPPADFRIGQPAALHRVLLNLVTNALKFTGEGFVEVVAAQRSRTLVEFSVRDSGRGIPDEVIATLFEPFRSRMAGGSRSLTFSSAGLGLAICRKLVNRLGGDLRVDSGAERGTRFYFSLELPLADKL
jgi:signal transduction histidine kinase